MVNVCAKKCEISIRKWQGVEAALDEITLPDQVPQAIEDYGRLESAGWKGQFGTAISSANRQGEFYRGVLEDFCNSGAGRIFRLRFNSIRLPWSCTSVARDAGGPKADIR